MDNINLQDWPPLHLAVDEDIDCAIQNDEPVVLARTSALIEAGTDEHVLNAEGQTARDVAAAYGQKALQLYDSVSHVDWSEEMTLQKFNDLCQDLLTAAGYSVFPLDSRQISVSKTSSGHSQPNSRIIINSNQWYGWRRNKEFAEHLISLAQEGLNRVP